MERCIRNVTSFLAELEAPWVGSKRGDNEYIEPISDMSASLECSPNRPRITVIVAHDGKGASGQFSATQRLVAGLAERGALVDLLCLPAWDRSLSWPRAALSFLRSAVKTLIAVASKCILPSERPQIVITALGQSYASWLREGLVTLMLSSACSILSICTLHSTYCWSWKPTSLKNRLFCALLRQFRAVVVLGPRMRAWLTSRGIDGVKNPSVSQIDNQAEIPALSPEQVQAKQGTSASERVRILFLSSLFESKGYHDLLGALESLDDTLLARISFVLCGAVQPNPFDTRGGTIAQRRASIQAQLSRLQMRGCAVLWCEGKSESEIAQLFYDAQVFILPSYTEAQPLVVIDALVAGCALITTVVGEIGDLVPDDARVSVCPGDQSALAAAIATLVNDDNVRRSIALRGHSLARERFSTTNIMQRWEELILSVLHSSSR